MPYCLTVVSSNIYVVSTFSRLWDANTALTNVNLCDSDDYSWLHRGTYIPHELNGINIGEIDVDCVTQEEIKSMKRREYQCEYQREYRKRKKASELVG